MSGRRHDFTLCEFLFPVLATGLYCAGFGIPKWIVVSDEYEAGLWTNCTINETLKEILEEQGDNKTREECEPIAPGDSDSYFEAVRVLSCFALVFYAFVVFSLFRDRNKKQCEGYTASFLSFLAVGLTGTVLLVFLENYKNDSHWLDTSFRYDVSVYLVIAGGGVQLASFFFLCRRGVHEKRDALQSYRLEQEQKREREEARKKREQEIEQQRRRADSTDTSEAEDSIRATGNQGQSQTTTESTAAATVATATARLAKNRVAPSVPRPPPTRRSANGHTPHREGTARSVRFRDRMQSTGSSSDISESSSVTISDNNDDDENSLPPPYYTSSSGRPFSPTAPSQTPLPWLTVPDPVGPPPAYDEVMINPDYYQAPYEEAVTGIQPSDYTVPPRPATADSVAEAGRARR